MEEPTFKLRFSIGDIEYWASRYQYDGDGEIEETVAPAVRSRGHLIRDEFLRICMWKSPRPRRHYEKNSEELVREATRIALSAAAEELRIGVLTVLEGVSKPVASTILHFCHAERYPILDFRALWSLGLEDRTVWYPFPFWWAYVRFCRRLADECGVSMRVLDRALWQYSRDNQRN